MERATASPQKFLLTGLVMLGLFAGLQSAVAGEGDHCPSGGQTFGQSGTVDGVSFQASGRSLTMTNTTTSEIATVSWCAEGKKELSNGSNISGVMSTGIPGGQSWSSSFDQDISQFVIYSVVHQDSGGPGPPPPGNGNGGGGDGDGGHSGGSPPKGGGPAASSAPAPAAPPQATGAIAPPPPTIVDQPTVTG